MSDPERDQNGEGEAEDDLLGTIRSIVAEEGTRPDAPARARSPLDQWRDDDGAAAAARGGQLLRQDDQEAPPLVLDSGLKVREDALAARGAAASPDLARTIHRAVDAAVPAIAERAAERAIDRCGGEALDERVRTALEAELARMAEEKLPALLAPVVRRLVQAEVARAFSRAAEGAAAGEDEDAAGA